MAGEMTSSELTRDAYPTHFALMDLYSGATVRPFDQYQGPYVLVPGHGKIWATYEDGRIELYKENSDTEVAAGQRRYPVIKDRIRAAATLLLGAPTNTRKTYDVYVVEGKYDGTWEDLTECDLRKNAADILKDYDDNEPRYVHRIKTVRKPFMDYDAVSGTFKPRK